MTEKPREREVEESWNGGCGRVRDVLPEERDDMLTTSSLVMRLYNLVPHKCILYKRRYIIQHMLYRHEYIGRR